MDTFYRKTWAEINLDNIAYNITQLKKRLAEHTEIIAVVKANAYGHGSVPVAKKALEAGATALAVAMLEEALVLREAGITAPILVLGLVSPAYAEIAASNDIMLTFFQQEWLEEVRAIPMEKEVHLHMKLDTGMGRIGIRTDEELIRILDVLKDEKNLKLRGVYTHFATADEADLDYFHQQNSRFNHLLALLKSRWTEKLAVHIGNSAASIRFPNDMHNFVRFGISMYGLYPSKIVKSEKKMDLKQAFSLHSKLIHVKKVAAGDSIGYGKTYTAQQEEWIGTIPIGYADGWRRKLQGFHVLIDGTPVPIVGRVCMDNMMVHLDKKYEIGTKVTLIGEQNHHLIEVDEVADYLDTINYEVPCMINERVPRKYIDNHIKF